MLEFINKKPKAHRTSDGKLFESPHEAHIWQSKINRIHAIEKFVERRFNDFFKFGVEERRAITTIINNNADELVAILDLKWPKEV